jgi:hypothetical protein
MGKWYSRRLRRSAGGVLAITWVYGFLMLLSSGEERRVQSAIQKKGPVPVPPSLRATLKHLLSNFTAIADEHALEYWMCSGTLLGAVREGGFIEWDDDIDLCAPRKTLDRLFNDSAVQSRCARSGIKIGFTDDIYRVGFANHPQVFMDIFEMEVCIMNLSPSPICALLHFFLRNIIMYYAYISSSVPSTTGLVSPIVLERFDDR